MPTATWERLPEARRSAIVRAAEEEFAAHGFSGGSLNVIARSANVAKGSLFQYFRDKADLYAYLSERASLRIREDMEVRIRDLDWAQGFFPTMRELMVVWEEYFHTHPLERAMTAAVNLEPDGSARHAVRRVANEHYLAVLRPMLLAAKERGDLRPDADVEAFLAMLLLLLPHLALAAHNPGLDPVLGLDSASPQDRVKAIDRLMAVFQSAFGATALTSSRGEPVERGLQR
ncbi:TetR/AcrR family transcriptional regulator [Planosporangium flavigriseum]|uniref:TetR family transcriptional regulator n=1 Tax=Planosporangium flavigriseum TaxID=373681 RepID=A0A8J3PN08_9ACTN|nr:TetR/AcrR family transcriptional regulator [Planosporangium flavigriseum]NJC65844.1 TetR/AcrR family transcriptional regulator [Planosporangium flavigriseum]GIG76111.1 TetR family transcriptional regulator [Planosporangium flavigriseum]